MSRIVLSPLDTERWGVVTAKANDVSEGVTEILDEARAHGVKLLIVRCATADLTVAQALERSGAEIMDTLVTYTRSLTDLPPPQPGVVRRAREPDAPMVRELARAAFAGYRAHYHADRRLDRHPCDEVYVDWAWRSCTSRGVADDVLVAEIDGRPVGFATLRGEEGVLFGVSPEAQGRGIYRALVIAGMERCASRGAERMIVCTQITNVAVQKVWVRLGFEPSTSRHTFHVWLA